MYIDDNNMIRFNTPLTTQKSDQLDAEGWSLDETIDTEGLKYKGELKALRKRVAKEFDRYLECANPTKPPSDLDKLSFDIHVNSGPKEWYKKGQAVAKKVFEDSVRQSFGLDEHKGDLEPRYPIDTVAGQLKRPNSFNKEYLIANSLFGTPFEGVKPDIVITNKQAKTILELIKFYDDNDLYAIAINEDDVLELKDKLND